MGNLFRRNQIQRNNNHQEIQQNNHNKMQQGHPVERSIKQVEHVYIKLRQQITKKQVQNLERTTPYIKMVENQTWFLNFTDQSINLPYLLSVVDECHGIKTIKTVAEKKSNFYIHLFSPKFINLNKLTLSNCHLESVQFIAYINMPQLKQLCLSDNLLTSIKPLRKMQSKLQILNIRRNYHLNLLNDQVYLINFNCKVECLNFQQNGKQYYGDDINWIFKLPVTSIFRFELDGNQRIQVSRHKVKKFKDMYKENGGIFCWGPRQL